jgi:hypothetical protein
MAMDRNEDGKLGKDEIGAASLKKRIRMVMALRPKTKFGPSLRRKQGITKCGLILV